MTLSKPELERLAELTRQHGAWLVIDDTYESFLFSGEPHHCPQGPHIIHVFSFSKARSYLPVEGHSMHENRWGVTVDAADDLYWGATGA